MSPRHPYVKLLIDSVPVPDPAYRWKEEERINLERASQEGEANGCPFYARCPQRKDTCKAQVPKMLPVAGSPEHEVACFLCQ